MKIFLNKNFSKKDKNSSDGEISHDVAKEDEILTTLTHHFLEKKKKTLK